MAATPHTAYASAHQWAQREIDDIIRCAQHDFADVPGPVTDEVDAVRCEREEPAWYRPCFRSERQGSAFFDSFNSQMRNAVLTLCAHFKQNSSEDHDHEAFFKERLARAAVPRTENMVVPRRVRVALYAAKLVARRLIA